jgi:ADP-L-glycero-D-manno-heptose 6-epimerase
MQILVTGYKGFIGSHLVEALETDGHDVTGYDYDESHGSMPYVAAYDWVIHVGAISSTTERDVNKIFKYNYDFSVQLYNECNMYGVNFQYASSASVYGNTDHFLESMNVAPQSPYAWTKYLFERVITNSTDTRIINQGFRYFNVYGHGEEHKGEQASVFTKFPLQAKKQGAITLFEGSDQFVRDFVSVEDVVQVHCKMLKVKDSGVYNVGTGTTTSFAEIASKYSEKLGVPINYIEMPDQLKNQYQSFTKANNTKLNNLIDIKWTTPTQWIDANVSNEAKDIKQPVHQEPDDLKAGRLSAFA